MATTRWGEVVDALVDTMRAATGYRAPSDADDGTAVTVFDGPEVGITDAGSSGAILVIGWSGDPESVEDSGRSGQVVATFGNRARDEAAEIVCMAIGQNGDNDVKAARDAALAIYADVEDALRADPEVGLNPGRYLLLQASEAVPTQYATANGVVCELLFTVTYQARI